MVKTIPILQIVGYQNSGKTTLVEKIVQKCTKIGIQVGTIKHHGHSGMPLLNENQKDSTKHRNAGAIVTTVEGKGAIELTSSGLNLNLEDILQIYKLLNTDAILIEGYKNKDFPKIILVKTPQDVIQLTKLANIQAIISWFKLDNQYSEKYRVFSIHDDDQYIEWLSQYLRGLYEQ